MSSNESVLMLSVLCRLESWDYYCKVYFYAEGSTMLQTQVAQLLESP